MDGCGGAGQEYSVVRPTDHGGSPRPFPGDAQELIQDLCKIGSKGDDPETRETGREHGTARWRSGYRLSEVLREIARIRELILAEIASICGERVSAQVQDEVQETTRRFFDTIAATSAQEFVHVQEAEVILRSNQLEHAYEQVQAVTEQLRMAVESRVSLVRAVTHELRNALQPVAFAADALLAEPKAESREEIRTELVTVAGRLQTLLDRLLELSKLLSGDARVRLVELNVDELLDDLRSAHQAGAEAKGLRFECGREGNLTAIVSDAEMLREIGRILLSNAIRSTQEGFVRVEARAGDDEQWMLRVTDSGSGIDPIEARHVFHEFHGRGDSANQGLRLGLIVARHLARLLGGEITFRSRVGEGSCFEVRLPREATEQR